MKITHTAANTLSACNATVANVTSWCSGKVRMVADLAKAASGKVLAVAQKLAGVAAKFFGAISQYVRSGWEAMKSVSPVHPGLLALASLGTLAIVGLYLKYRPTQA